VSALRDADPVAAELIQESRWSSGGGAGRIVRRLLTGLAVLFVVSLIVFAATQALPADPARAILGREATPERLAALRAELGLDRPTVEQYLDWLGGVVTLDFGSSLAAREPVVDMLSTPLRNSIILLLLAAGIGIPLSVVLGALAALRRDGWFDKTLLGVVLLLTAVPEFVIGLLLVILLGTTVLTVLPAVALIPPGESPLLHLDELVLPVATLVLAIVPYLSRLVRASVIDALSSDYVEMARLKGMPELVVLRRHALPNALVATVQASAVVLVYLLAGIVVVEFIFRYPGLGTALTDAVDARDLPVIQALVLIFATGAVLFNAVADTLTVLLTPRLRTSRR
jgi:peptide/nickel transport system permease protein